MLRRTGRGAAALILAPAPCTALCEMHRLQDLLRHGAGRRSVHGRSALVAGHSGFTCGKEQPRLELSTLLALHKIKKLPLSRSWQRVLDSGPLHAPLAAIDMRRFRIFRAHIGFSQRVVNRWALEAWRLSVHCMFPFVQMTIGTAFSSAWVLSPKQARSTDYWREAFWLT